MCCFSITMRVMSEPRSAMWQMRSIHKMRANDPARLDANDEIL
jgi:hypothetical protein